MAAVLQDPMEDLATPEIASLKNNIRLLSILADLGNVGLCHSLVTSKRIAVFTRALSLLEKI
jgi:hypothetical protein